MFEGAIDQEEELIFGSEYSEGKGSMGVRLGQKQEGIADGQEKP
jgi:hypothetical protein